MTEQVEKNEKPVGGTPNTGDATGQNGGNGEPILTQADIDRIVGQRVARERQNITDQLMAQYADYDNLKDAAQKWSEHEETQKTEEERRAEQLRTLEQERDEAKQAAEKAGRRLMRKSSCLRQRLSLRLARHALNNRVTPGC